MKAGAPRGWGVGGMRAGALCRLRYTTKLRGRGDWMDKLRRRERPEAIGPFLEEHGMKGVVLAGGLGSRLDPLTRITNKHLLPVYDKPMIYYPIETLVNAGMSDILIVTGGQNAGDFLRLLGNGRDFGLKHIDYTYQEGEGGIAEALELAEHFSDGQKICVVLGDNLIEGNIVGAAQAFRDQEGGARILLKAVPDAERFGVAEIQGEHIMAIEEKPRRPKSNYAVTGIYMYDATVFDKINTLEPSRRGELEITDVNNLYIQEATMTFSMLEGWWTDAGTIDSLQRASTLVAETGANKLDLSTSESADRLPQIAEGD